MKKQYIFALSAILLLSSCGAKPTVETTAASTTAVTSEATTVKTTVETTTAETTVATTTSVTMETTTTTPVVTESITTESDDTVLPFGKSKKGIEVGITEVLFGFDDKGNTVANVTYSFFNGSDKAASFAFSVNDTVMQNGVELEESYYSDFSEDSDTLADVLPGYSNSIKKSYILTSDSSILFSIAPLIAFDDEKFFELELYDGKFSEVQPINTEQLSGVNPLTISNTYITTNYDGGTVLVVEYDFTNFKDDSSSFALSFTDKAYQNGIECDGYVSCNGVETQDQLNKIMPGVTYKVAVGYPLNNDTDDVLIRVEKALDFSDDKLVLEQTIKLN